MSAALPWTCPDHPEAQIRHEWDRRRDTYRLTGASIVYNVPGSHRYYCNECGRELAAEDPGSASAAATNRHEETIS